MGEVEHVLFDKCLLDLLVGPVDEKLVVEVCFLGQASTEINWVV
jgi:hypothetical protein